MNHIKKVNEMFDELMLIPFKFTNNENDNLKKISNLLNSLSSKWSNYVEYHPEMDGCDTEAVVRQLSLVAKKLSGEWDEQICF